MFCCLSFVCICIKSFRNGLWKTADAGDKLKKCTRMIFFWQVGLCLHPVFYSLCRDVKWNVDEWILWEYQWKTTNTFEIKVCGCLCFRCFYTQSFRNGGTSNLWNTTGTLMSVFSFVCIWIQSFRNSFIKFLRTWNIETYSGKHQTWLID
jgi:hypothetical protein